MCQELKIGSLANIIKNLTDDYAMGQKIAYAGLTSFDD